MMAAAPRPPLLVATDFSPSANLAVDRAALLAAQHDWPLHLAHAIAPGFLDELQRLLTPQVPAISSSLVGKAMAELQTLANDSRHTHGLDTDCHVLLGKPVDALLQHASDLCSSLLVVGLCGETSLRHAFPCLAQACAVQSAEPRHQSDSAARRDRPHAASE